MMRFRQWLLGDSVKVTFEGGQEVTLGFLEGISFLVNLCREGWELDKLSGVAEEP